MKNSALLLVAMLILSVACKSKYEKGFEAGQDQGYTEGYDDGYVDGDKDGYDRGMADGEEYYTSATYEDGVSDGMEVGLSIGYNQGYNVGYNETYGPAYSQGKADGYQPGYNAGRTAGYNQGYNEGNADGYDDGFDDGRATIQWQINWAYDDGYDDGYEDGYDDGWYAGDAHGYNDGYGDGYDDGFDDAYDIGYDDGWDAAYYSSLSVKPSKSMKGTSNILSMVHNDMFNYAKIPAPKQTKRGLVAGSKLIFEETSLSNKDLEKRAAAVEKYLVSSMASQVKAQFGLSNERSSQIAKVANHFRKQTSSRAISEADSNAYAKEILGANFKEIETAFKGSLKGDQAQLGQVLEQAAQKNNTTPEHMSSIMYKIFF